MTATLTTAGQVTIPAGLRQRYDFRPGMNFTVGASGDGDITLHPVKPRPRKKDLGEALRAMRGLEIKRFDEPVRIIIL